MTWLVGVWSYLGSPIEGGELLELVLLTGLTLSKQKVRSPLSWPHRHRNKVSLVAVLTSLTWLSCLAMAAFPSFPFWHFGTESRGTKVQILCITCKSKDRNEKLWLFRELWKVLCSGNPSAVTCGSHVIQLCKHSVTGVNGPFVFRWSHSG